LSDATIAAPRTSLQCVCTRRRNCCIGQLSPSPEYARQTAPFPARNSATIKLITTADRQARGTHRRKSGICAWSAGHRRQRTGESSARRRTALLKKNPPLATGPSLGRKRPGIVSRFAAALCVAIHTCRREMLFAAAMSPGFAGCQMQQLAPTSPQS
jgi:hypothetical protein